MLRGNWGARGGTPGAALAGRGGGVIGEGWGGCGRRCDRRCHGRRCCFRCCCYRCCRGFLSAAAGRSGSRGGFSLRLPDRLGGYGFFLRFRQWLLCSFAGWWSCFFCWPGSPGVCLLCLCHGGVPLSVEASGLRSNREHFPCRHSGNQTTATAPEVVPLYRKPATIYSVSPGCSSKKSRTNSCSASVSSPTPHSSIPAEALHLPNVSSISV